MTQVHTAPLERGGFYEVVFNEKQAAAYLGVSLSTLRRRRADRTGPDFIQIDRIIQYRKPALDEYLERHTVRCKRAAQ